MRPTRFLVLTLLFVASALSAVAEHRVALLVGGASAEVVEMLGDVGARCERYPEPDRKRFRSTVENFANRTPTNGAAIVYFAGEISQRDGDIVLLAANEKEGAKGYPASELLSALESRGGSRRQILVVDAPRPAGHSVEYPDGCTMLFRTAGLAALLKEPASMAISAPGEFVVGKQVGDEWINSRGTIFCWCPPGKFLAGSPPGTPGRFADEEQRQVVIKEGFWISKYELSVTENPRSRSNKPPQEAHKNHPLTLVNHDDAKQMTWRILSEEGRKSARLPAGWQYSLPTEEQWEYAARGGSKTLYSFGDRVDQLPHFGNFGDRSYYDSKDIFSNAAHRTLDDGYVRFAPVGSFKPNSFGLHDVHGNVAEWCLNGSIRGGSWVSSPNNCRSAYRDHFSSRNQQEFIGYRIVIQRTPPASKGKKK